MNFFQYSSAEYRADLVVHVVSLSVFALAATYMMMEIIPKGDELDRRILLLYIFCGGLIFATSALYNILPASKLKLWLQITDHAAIFLMISGTYTPTIYYLLNGNTMIAVLTLWWAIALLGIVMRIAFEEAFNQISIPYYILHGWGGLIVIAAINGIDKSFSEPGYIWMVIGGIVYTLGIGFHLAEQLPFHNAIWHIFVLAAAAIQFKAVLLLVTKI